MALAISWDFSLWIGFGLEGFGYGSLGWELGDFLIWVVLMGLCDSLKFEGFLLLAWRIFRINVWRVCILW